MIRSDPQVGATLHWRDTGLPSDQRPWALAAPSLLVDAGSKVPRVCLSLPVCAPSPGACSLSPVMSSVASWTSEGSICSALSRNAQCHRVIRGPAD